MEKKKYARLYARYLGGRNYVRKIGITTTSSTSEVDAGNVLLLQSGYLLLQDASKLLINS